MSAIILLAALRTVALLSSEHRAYRGSEKISDNADIRATNGKTWIHTRACLNLKLAASVWLPTPGLAPLLPNLVGPGSTFPSLSVSSVVA